MAKLRGVLQNRHYYGRNSPDHRRAAAVGGSEKFVEQNNLKPLARFSPQHLRALTAPDGHRPVPAVANGTESGSLSATLIWSTHEAFARRRCVRSRVAFDREKLNVNGAHCAGSSHRVHRTRITVTCSTKW